MKIKIFTIIIVLTVSAYAEEKYILTIKQAKKLALSQNREILIAKEGLNSSDGQLIDARSSFFPKLSLSGNYNYISNIPSMSISIPAGLLGNISKQIDTGLNNNWAFKATLSQTLFDWGRMFNNYNVASINSEISKYDLNYVTSQILFNVIQSFNSAILAEKVLTANKESLKIAEEHLKTSEQRFKQGATSSFEVLRSKVQVSGIKPLVSKASNNLEMAKNNLKSILGLQLNKEITVEGELSEEEFPESNYEESFKKAKSNRAEISKMKKRKEMLESLLAVISSADKPMLNASLSYNYQNPYYTQLSWVDSYNAGVSLNFPLFDGFSTSGKVKQTEADIESSRLSISNIENAVELEVKQAILNLSEVRDRIKYQKDAVAQAEEYLKIAESSFKTGVVTNLEVMDAQLSLLSAKTTYLQTLYDYVSAKNFYLKAIGELK